MLPKYAETKKYQSKANQMAHQSTLQPGSYQNTQTKCQYAAPVQHILTAHKNTPCLSYAGGVGFLTA